MQVALIRHPAPAIAPGVCYGRTDIALAPSAQPDLARLAAELASFPPAPIWCSPARRCRDTAAAIAGGRAVWLDDRLRELDFGAWEGLRWDDIPRAALDAWAADPSGFTPPGGESAASLVARVTEFHATLVADAVVIAHGGPLKILAALCSGRPIDVLAPAPPLGVMRVITMSPPAR